jgi:uncharacterized protein (AIM24 family)
VRTEKEILKDLRYAETPERKDSFLQELHDIREKESKPSIPTDKEMREKALSALKKEREVDDGEQEQEHVTEDEDLAKLGDDEVTSQTTRGVVAVGSHLSGDVLEIKLQPGESYFLSKTSFLACTDNVHLSVGLRGIRLIPYGHDNKFVLPKVTNTSNHEGRVWLASHGSFETIVVPAGDTLLLNECTLLACQSTLQWQPSSFSKSLLSSLYGGEGFGLMFHGPCTVYTQSKNYDRLILDVASRMPTGPDIDPVVIGDILDHDDKEFENTVPDLEKPIHDVVPDPEKPMHDVIPNPPEVVLDAPKQIGGAKRKTKKHRVNTKQSSPSRLASPKGHIVQKNRHRK